MAYEIFDGFDHYDASHAFWDTLVGTPSFSTSFARFPAAPNCVAKGVNFGSSVSATKNLAGNRAGLVVSTAFMLSALPATGNEEIIHFKDSGNTQTMFAISPSGQIVIICGSTVVQGITASGIISPGVYYFVDIVITFASGTGTCSVYLSTPAGGGPILALTGINTINTANSWANQVQIGELNGRSINVQFDDFHCFTNSGGVPNAALGEGTRILTKMPNGAGYATTLTPNGAAANWQCVDEVPPDDDTTYVSAASFPLTEGYAVGAAGFTGVVNGVTRKSRIRKDDASAHTFTNGVRSSSTNVMSSPANVQSTYAWLDAFFAQDPATSAAWTAAGADAAQPIISAAS